MTVAYETQVERLLKGCFGPAIDGERAKCDVFGVGGRHGYGEKFSPSVNRNL